MTVEELPERSSYRIFFPSKTKSGTPIPHDKRSQYLREVMARCSDVNGGGTVFHNVEGFFRTKDGKIILEGVSLIETAGRKPFSDEELAVLAKDLDQESILIQEMGSCRSIFVSGEIEEFTDSFEVTSQDGSKSVFYKEDTVNGEMRYVRMDYDEFGDLIAAGPVTESEMAADEVMSEPLDEDFYKALKSLD